MQPRRVMMYRSALAVVLIGFNTVTASQTDSIRDLLCKRLCPNYQKTCTQSPTPPPCPSVYCPLPECPPPICPEPVCPTLPSCPIVKCAPCLSCPECPNIPQSCNNGQDRGPEISTCPPCPKDPTRPLSSFPDGYEVYPYIGAYKYYSTNQTWKIANATCFKDGGHLAIPDSPVELSIIKRIMKEHNSTTGVYIGFHDYDRDNEYISVLGDAMTPFQTSLWSFGFPLNLPGGNGVVLSPKGELWYMGNFLSMSFVCEIKYS